MNDLITRDDPFFVGYLPMPRALRRFTIAALLGIALFVLGLAIALARSTEGAGKARFAFANGAGTVGVLQAKPSAILWTIDDKAPGGVSGILLVRQGKFGLGAQAEALDGKVVRLDGTVIERDGRRMLELSGRPVEAPDALDAAMRARITARTDQHVGSVTLQGEIVDSKCYLGRMRPGDGRTHRACAQQCIAGGIPPVLVTRDAGTEQHYLLADPNGAPIHQPILPFVAEPVRVTGELYRAGDVLVLRTNPSRIERL